MPIDPKKLDGHKEFDQKFLKIIDEFGWHVMSVAPRTDQEGDLWSYSTGFFYHYKHPEIIVFNQSIDLHHSMINVIGNRVKAGETFKPGKGYSDIIGNFDVQFRPMHPSHYWDWLNFACWFYDGNPATFPVLQCFWPDMNGRFPWEPGCEQWAIEQQPFHDQPTASDKERIPIKS
jgi:hypothetical protein